MFFMKKIIVHFRYSIFYTFWNRCFQFIPHSRAQFLKITFTFHGTCTCQEAIISLSGCEKNSIFIPFEDSSIEAFLFFFFFFKFELKYCCHKESMNIKYYMCIKMIYSNICRVRKNARKCFCFLFEKQWSNWQDKHFPIDPVCRWWNICIKDFFRQWVEFFSWCLSLFVIQDESHQEYK